MFWKINSRENWGEFKGGSRILKWGVNFCNNVREIKYYFNIRGIRKKKEEEGGSEKGGWKFTHFTSPGSAPGIRTTCRAVYLYDNANKHTLIRPWRNEEQKVDKLKKRHYTRIAVLQSLINRLGKRRGKMKKKKLQHGVFVFGHPAKY